MDLKIDRALLNSNFDGYKLNLDVFPVGHLPLDTPVDSPKLSSDIYSYKHAKLFGTINNLYLDPWCDHAVWFITCNLEILKVHAAPQYGVHLKGPVLCYTISRLNENKARKIRFPITLNFPNEDLMLVCDGAGRLIILKTSNRRDELVKCEEWYSGMPLGEEIAFCIIHSEFCIKEGQQYLEILCMNIIEKNGTNNKFHSSTYLEWLTFNLVSAKQFELFGKRTLKTTCIPDFAAVVGGGTKVVVISERVVKFVHDTLQPDRVEDIGFCRNNGSYTWMQNGREVKVSFKLKEGISTSDVNYHLSHDSIYLKINSYDDYLISGNLANKISLEQCTWNISGSSLEICLMKADDSMWSELIVGDMNWQCVPTDHTTLLENEIENQTVYNTQELEECDYSENSSIIYWFDGCTHTSEQLSLSGYQWLFSNVTSLSNLPVICIRHDVDGLVFSLENISSPPGTAWKHVATFDALGYVQASKRQKKFTVCAPDFSYVAIVEVSRHVFIYRQSCESSVTSRKTREKLSVAKHHMVTLETSDIVEGAVATCCNLLILTERNLYCIKVN